MLSKEYLETARTLFRIARNMADQTVADRLKTLAEDYARRAEQASRADAASASTSRNGAAGRRLSHDLAAGDSSAESRSSDVIEQYDNNDLLD